MATLNRPALHNVWNPAMGPILEAHLKAWDSDDSVRVIVITGSGTSFCAGADISALKGVDESGRSPFPERAPSDDELDQRYSCIMGLKKPVICAINGAAIGIGMVLPIYCDIRYAVPGAKLGVVFARRGLVAEHGIGWMLPRMIGLPRAAEWLMSGRIMQAEEA